MSSVSENRAAPETSNLSRNSTTEGAHSSVIAHTNCRSENATHVTMEVVESAVLTRSGAAVH